MTELIEQLVLVALVLVAFLAFMGLAIWALVSMLREDAREGRLRRPGMADLKKAEEMKGEAASMGIYLPRTPVINPANEARKVIRKVGVPVNIVDPLKLASSLHKKAGK